jgi:phosphatidylinositol-3-phosphatase
MRRFHGVLFAALLMVALPAVPAGATVAPVRHVFVINLENKGYDDTWGAGSAAPYLSTTLRAQGRLLTQYWGIGHASLDNYIAQVSGQGPNLATQLDCPIFAGFWSLGAAPMGQARGLGCVYPSSVKTVADQLQGAGLSWKGYMQDIGTPCRHPVVGTPDTTQKAKVGDQYATRHDPFMYFHSIIDNPASCAQHVVDLNGLTSDLSSAATTPNLSYITPNLCDDGHDGPCVDGRPGGLTSADAWLQTWVPKIMASPAYKQDGLLVITFDEADSSDAGACCGEGPSANSLLPGLLGFGGGRVGALLLSPSVTAGSQDTTPYNHYGLLRTIEDTFALPHLGYAGSSGAHTIPLS